MSRLAALAFAFGATLGLWEAVWALLGNAHVSGSEGVIVLALAGIAYGLASATVAVAVIWISVKCWPSRAPEPSAVAATVVAIGTMVAIQQIRKLAGYGDAGLWWLIPGCALFGVASGLVAGWCAARIRPSRLLATWSVLALMALAIGLGASLRGALGPATGSAQARPQGPNVMLISVDTLRSDRLGCYGRTPTLTPRLDALARQSVLFENAMSPIALTGPSHTTMLTGLYPHHHGATTNGVPISPDVETVAEILERAGYRTAAFVSGWPLSDDSSRLAPRFQRYDEDFSRWSVLPAAVFRLAVLKLTAALVELTTGTRIDPNERAGERTVARAVDWIAQQGDHPFFAFVHLYEPHAPYAPPGAIVQELDPAYEGERDSFRPWHFSPAALAAIVNDPHEVQHIQALYDAEVAYADSLVGRLLDGLEEAGLAEETLLLFTADHGESLTEHGTFFDHDEFLYEHDVHVPLLVRFPDGRLAGARRTQQVRLVDLAPTVLDLVGEPPRTPLDGASLLGIADGSEATDARIAFGSVEAGFGESARARYYVRAHGYKLIWTFDRRGHVSPGPAFEELYDLTTDPGELRNLMLTDPPPPPAPPPAILTQLRDLLAEHVRQHTSMPPSIDDEVRQRLRSLGYL